MIQDVQYPACKLMRCPAYCYDDPGMRSISFKIFYGKRFEVHSVGIRLRSMYALISFW